ncbi:EF-hand calcium-binding domain-containing protein 1-like [Aphis craccivora]|uniref:EF-hand calcium-binding domain-containing protein 1-like n=1 Tax=Aphis craccivora TaxID=307492 RepID=A0A6G0YFL8_APHCR|nr:EF-hand calcium-binding domain-containing protein 1-like [Aphis craccivora]
MPYSPINKCGLPVTIDIRLQHRFSDIGSSLSRTTYFNKTESLRLLQMHYMLTKENGIMDISRFVKFMNVFLGLKNVEALNKVHQISCKTNNKYLTGPEFVIVLSLLLRGTVSDLIDFWFDLYKDKLRSTDYKCSLLQMIDTDNTNKAEHHQKLNIDYIMHLDDRISLEDHRKFVNEIVTGLKLLRSIIPETDRKVPFMLLFTSRLLDDDSPRGNVKSYRVYDYNEYRMNSMQKTISKLITQLEPSM